MVKRRSNNARDDTYALCLLSIAGVFLRLLMQTFVAVAVGDGVDCGGGGGGVAAAAAAATVAG